MKTLQRLAFTALALGVGAPLAPSPLAAALPPPPTGWEVIFLQPAGDYHWSVAYAASGSQQAGFAITMDQHYHAGLWNGTAQSWVDLHPAWATDSWIYGASGGQQVGWAASGFYRASLWSGTAQSWVDLHPADCSYSKAYAIADGQQVGEVGLGEYWHASLWTGSAESWVDLNPPGCLYSCAYGVSGGQQVGEAVFHASLWRGSAESWVDLHPKNAKMSAAYDVSGGQQVGSAQFKIKGKDQTHAGLWIGTAESWVDLHPSGYDGSEARGASQGYQAGSAWISGEHWHAGLWHGTGGSWVDLSTLLPAGYGDSAALDIAATTTDLWVVGYANAGNSYAVLWHKKLAAPTPPQFVNLQAPGPHGMPLTLRGDPGGVVQIYASSNLTAWVWLGTLTNSTGQAVYTDPAATNQPRRFYRAIQLP